jgi:hypothetical protein
MILMSKDQLDAAVIEYLRKRGMIPADGTVRVMARAEVDGNDMTSLTLEVEYKERKR